MHLYYILKSNKNILNARNSGFKNYLTNLNNLKCIAFLGDLLRIFKHFQKKIQSNSLTLPWFCEEVRILRDNLLDFKEKALPGGFESALNDEILIENNQATLKGIDLFIGSRSRQIERSIESFRSDVIDRLIAYLNERLDVDNSEQLSLIESFIKIDRTIDTRKVHELLGKDLDLTSFHMQLNDLANAKSEIKNMSTDKLLKYLLEPNSLDHFC